MKEDRLTELAVAFSSGNITPDERGELMAALAGASASTRQEIAELVDAAAAVSLLIPAEAPSASLKQKILSRTRKQQRTNPPLMELLSFMPQAAEMGWQATKIPGAYFKLLSANKERGYAVALGKLDPNSSYPAHAHKGAEDLLILSGDLWIGDERLQAGDFHHAEPGSEHGVNHSESGCTILIVLALEDLMAQMA